MSNDQNENGLESISRSARGERKNSREETGRKSRVPLGVSRPKLAVQGREGYVRRWINDVEGRLQQAEQGGYTFVEDSTLQVGAPDVDNGNRDLGARVSRVVDKSTGMRAYLMEIKKEYYEEDQRIKLQEVDEIESAIKRGALDNEDASHRYVPDKGRGIKISRT